MKKIIVTICLTAMVAFGANAQFHVELGLNFNSPQGDFADSYKLGVGFYLEPKYALNENLDLGLFIGSNGFAGGDVVSGGQTGSAAATAIVPVLATGTYRFSGSKVTPYAGIGAGMYFARAAEVTVGTVTQTGEGESKFGFAPRAGVYVGRLNLGAAYNIVSDANFIQFNLGFRILSRD